MGLEDIVPEPDYPVGSVTSRMDAENITMSRHWWEEVVAVHYPHLFEWDLRSKSTEQLKLYIELLDSVIQDELRDTNVSEEEKEEARLIREQIILELSRR